MKVPWSDEVISFFAFVHMLHSVASATDVTPHSSTGTFKMDFGGLVLLPFGVTTDWVA